MKRLTLLLLPFLTVATGFSAAITDGNLLIYRVGTGAAALTSAATAVFLDEYTTTGTFVQSIALPTTGSSALTAVGTSTTEGIISRSQDGNMWIFTGYRADTGVASPTATGVNKVIGTITVSGVASTSVAITDVGANAIRSATSVDGSSFYIATANAVRYVGTPSGASTSVSIDARNSRQVNLYGNTLYAANGAAITSKLQSYGTLPTTATTPTTVVSLATGDAINGFALFDLDSGVAGVDTLYALSTVEGLLRKYTYDGSTWAASGSVSSGAANLAGYVDGTDVKLFLTSATTLFSLTDSSGYNANITGSLTSLASAGVNTAFRGIGITPVPEPTALSLGLVAAGLMIFRRRRA
jgi:hypothetical protein